MLAFLTASRQPYPPPESYWAPDVLRGVGWGAYSLVLNVAYGLGGVLYEPYKGAKEEGIVGFSYGVARGLGGLIYRPIRGSFDLIT